MDTALHIIRSLDVSIYYLLSRFAGNGIVCRLVRLEETDNLLKGGIFFAVLWHHWFRSDSEQGKRRCNIIAILTGSILAVVAARVIAFVAPFRLRPMDDPTVLHPLYALSFVYNLEHWSAFPSDTAAYCFALAIGIAYLSRRSAIPILLYTTLWICLSRMFLGLHYASDIVVGAGIAIVVVLLSIKSKFVHSFVAQPLFATASRNNGWFYPVAFLISFEMATVFQGSRTLGNAVFHLVAAGLHFRILGAVDENRPIDAWGGLIGMAICLAILTYILRILFRKFRSLPSRHSVSTSGVLSAPAQAGRVRTAGRLSAVPAHRAQSSRPEGMSPTVLQ
jgi:undecaprenyl-diphosphatase